MNKKPKIGSKVFFKEKPKEEIMLTCKQCGFCLNAHDNELYCPRCQRIIKIIWEVKL